MKKPFEWKDTQNGAVQVLTIPVQGALLVIFKKDPKSLTTSTSACVIHKSELDAFSPESEIQNHKAIESYRILGDPTTLQALHQKLQKLGWIAGKNVEIPTLPAHVQFLPLQGRIRLEKASESTEKTNQRKTRVLVVDDSETIRKLLSKIISEDPALECVGTIERPSLVENAILTLKPDVITLDIHMPEMDGVTLLKQILQKFPIPTIMISSLSKEEGTSVLDALEAGAVDYIQKPSFQEIQVVAPLICEKIRNARTANVQKSFVSTSLLSSKGSVLSTDSIDHSYLIAIGSSTGGTEALKHVLTRMPSQIPPIVIVQHIPPVFSKAFADRMNQLCPFEVKEAQDGDEVCPNRVLIAPGGKQMKVVSRGGMLRISIDDSAPVNRHKPSVDYLFHSIHELGVKKVAAAILTGMGADGAKGLLELKNAGAKTVAQNEATCVVYGMPREAARLGAAQQVVPLDQIAATLMKYCSARYGKVA